jgi:hypothetical protein
MRPPNKRRMGDLAGGLVRRLEIECLSAAAGEQLSFLHLLSPMQPFLVAVSYIYPRVGVSMRLQGPRLLANQRYRTMHHATHLSDVIGWSTNRRFNLFSSTVPRLGTPDGTRVTYGMMREEMQSRIADLGLRHTTHNQRQE